VAAGDVNGDGRDDLIVGRGPGGLPTVRVYTNTNGGLANGWQMLDSFTAFGTGFKGGVFVAAGYLDGDNRAEIIVGKGFGGNSVIRIFRGTNRSLMASHTTFPTNGGGGGLFGDDNVFKAGIRVATADVNGDGRSDIIVAPGRGEQPRVKILNGVNLAQIDLFFADEQNFLGGVYVGGS
jgi:hypothetical protein